MRGQSSVLFVVLAVCFSSAATAAELKVGVFRVDATPPVGSPVAYAPARKIADPLSARGIVLLGAGKPIVLCAVDWIGIGNSGQDVWKEQLAKSAGTSPDRVAVHTLHQHDAPRCDFGAAELADKHGVKDRFDSNFARQIIERTAAAVTRSIAEARPVTHLGVGQATVEKVASNRRVMGADGKVAIVRYSATKNPRAIAATEGLIDPTLKLISLWDGATPLVAITFYATHPMSYYGQGEVSADFIGLARAEREKALPQVPHIHFNGAGGNVTAGKYNDGSSGMRPALTQRMADGMEKAWNGTKRQPIAAADVQWRTRPVLLPPAPHLKRQELEEALNTGDAAGRFQAALKLEWLERVERKTPIDLALLRLGNVDILSLPGELFIEYQLAAQKLRPEGVVCVAAYGDYGPGYIGTEIAYWEGGYETSPRASNVAPAVEKVLMASIRELLQTEPRP